MFEPNLAYDEDQLQEISAALIRDVAEIGYLRLARVVRGDVVADTVKMQWTPEHLSYHHGGRPPETPEEMAEAALRCFCGVTERCAGIRYFFKCFLKD